MDHPLGARLDETGCHFCVWAPQSDKVELCLFDEQEQEQARLALPGRRGQYWFGHVRGVKAGQRYGYRVHGSPQDGLLFDPDKLLIDPYARALSRPTYWDDALYQGTARPWWPSPWWWTMPSTGRGRQARHPARAGRALRDPRQGLHPPAPRDPQGAAGHLSGHQPPADDRAPAVAGVTSVQLMPVAAFMSEPRLEQLGLTNYWGYNPIAFFAPSRATRRRRR